MLSSIQRAVRFNENQLILLSEEAIRERTHAGYLQKRSGDSNKWHVRWFVLYQNMLFYYESETSNRPHGVILLEHCYCERLITIANSFKSKNEHERMHCFVISSKKGNQRQYEFRASNEHDCNTWIQFIHEASFNRLAQEKEELEQRHLHVIQILKSERACRWQYTQQCEELSIEIKKMRLEFLALKKAYKAVTGHSASTDLALEPDTPELRKIRKVQSFFRGWLCRRRWKQIVEQYIRSPHAESMRRRNALVFRLVESEEEYTESMEVLVTCFFRPFRMAASSKKPPCSHDDVNAIFLNSETVLFLHQIFFKGLTSRLENWPTLVLGDLFNLLLPMLSIYQEYVRNHYYSMQVLTACKQAPEFVSLLKRLENKAACEGRTIEAFLTNPMHQISRYIITLHDLLAHTPHDHVERKSLHNAREQLEDLSRQMNDEVSETENLRKILEIERMIVEGCDVLLDVNQVFVRQGPLIHLPSDDPNVSPKKETVRQCFLFSFHLIITTRDAEGKLNLLPNIGKVPLANITLAEDPNETEDDEDAISPEAAGAEYNDFKIILERKTNNTLAPYEQVEIHFMAPSVQEKQSWISDINQCLLHLQCDELTARAILEYSLAASKSLKNDPRLFKDEADIRFSKTVNSCKVPHIRYASSARLLQRLTDFRFLSIDFLNTFLLTYRVFTDGVTVLDALTRAFFESQLYSPRAGTSSEGTSGNETDALSRRSNYLPRRISATSSVSGYCSEISEKSYDSQSHRNLRAAIMRSEVINMSRRIEQQHLRKLQETSQELFVATVPQTYLTQERDKTALLSIPKVRTSSSSDTLTDVTVVSIPSSPGTKTLVEDSSFNSRVNLQMGSVPIANPKQKSKPQSRRASRTQTTVRIETTTGIKKLKKGMSGEAADHWETTSFYATPYRPSRRSTRSTTVAGVLYQHLEAYYAMGPNSTIYEADESGSTESSYQHDFPGRFCNPGIVISAPRKSRERSSSSVAAHAFAVATSAAGNPRDTPPNANEAEEERRRRQAYLTTASTLRVLNVLRHWISKYHRDFENDLLLKRKAALFLEEVAFSSRYLRVEHKIANYTHKVLMKEACRINVFQLVAAPAVASEDTIETLNPRIIAQQLTYLDYQIFISISSEEFLGQAWMKSNKATKAPHILLMTKRFNDVSRLVASDIIRRSTASDRAAIIEKWAEVANAAATLHNYNGVLQICSAFSNSAVFRLKKTWEKVSKTTKRLVDILQATVSSDGRFRSLRDALHRSDPPCMPYLGMYLTDLSFIEEGTPTITNEGLLNFSKLRMIAHVLREIRHYQETPYKIVMEDRVAHFLLDTSRLLDDDALYNRSLQLEPRTSRLSTSDRGQSGN